MKLVYDFYNELLVNKFTLVYEGEITHQVTKAFASLTETKMDSYSENTSIKKKVFHVLIECLQNLSKHANDNSPGLKAGFSGNGIFIVGRLGNEDKDYQILTGNMVENMKIPELKALLEEINHLDKNGLKELFKKQIREGSLSEKGGASLGLIDVARKTGEKLEYNFIDIDDQNSFFILRTKITRN